jgi:hypothetical protein
MKRVRWTRFGRVALVFLVLSAASRWGNAAVGQVGPAHQPPADVSLWARLGERLQTGLGDLLGLIGFGNPDGHAKAGGAGGRRPAAASTSCASSGGTGTSAGSSGSVQPGELFPGIDPNGGFGSGN